MTNPLCVHCHQPQAAHYRVVAGESCAVWDYLLVCPSGTWQAPQELDVPVRHDTGTAKAVQGRTVERLHADSTPESLATQLAAMTAERDEANVKLDALLRRFPTDPPAVGVELSCLLCGQVKPWATWYLGTAVCLDCRDARFRPTADQLGKVVAERDDARDQLAGCCACQHDGRGALTSEWQEHQEQREALAVLRTARRLFAVDSAHRLGHSRRAKT